MGLKLTILLMLCLGNVFYVRTEIEEVIMYTWNINSKCGNTGMSGYYSGYIRSHSDRGNYDYTEATDCTYTVQARNDDEHEEYQIRWQWRTYFDVSNVWVPDGEPGPCYGTYVELHDGASTDDPSLTGPLCGTDMPDDVATTGSSMTFHFVASGPDPDSNKTSVIDFRGMWTDFRYGDKNCSDDFPWDLEFNCGNGICLPAELACDKTTVDHCLNAADTLDDITEQCDETDKPVEPFDPWPIIYGVLSVLTALMVFLLFWCLWRPGAIYWLLGCCRRWYCCGFCYDGCPFFHSLCCQGTDTPRGPCCTCGRHRQASHVAIYGGPAAPKTLAAQKYRGLFTDVNMAMASGRFRTTPVMLKGGPAFKEQPLPPAAPPTSYGSDPGVARGPAEVRNLALYSGTGGHFREGRF